VQTSPSMCTPPLDVHTHAHTLDVQLSPLMYTPSANYCSGFHGFCVLAQNHADCDDTTTVT